MFFIVIADSSLYKLSWQQIALLGPVPMHGVAKISFYSSSFLISFFTYGLDIMACVVCFVHVPRTLETWNDKM